MVPFQRESVELERIPLYFDDHVSLLQLHMATRQARLLPWLYRRMGKPVPYYAFYPLWLLAWKPVRKFINVVVLPNIPINAWRVWGYRRLGYNIGRNVFIGMKCYLDDVEPHLTTIEDNVIISYGCYFAAHGHGQTHTPITIRRGAYVGMGTKILSGKTGIEIGEEAVIGAGAVVQRTIPSSMLAVGVPARVIGIAPAHPLPKYH